jgi:hypothetical protein
MLRKDVAKKVQFVERPQFAAGDLMSLDKGTHKQWSTRPGNRLFPRRGSLARIHDTCGLGMCEKKNLLSADAERVFEPGHQL